MNKAILYFIAVICVALTISCNNNNNSNSTKPNAPNNSNTPKNPDPTIEVKEDFSQLTKADEEKEDKSHMDMSYFPSNYALNKALNQNVDLSIRVVYSRPHKGNRTQIFGNDSTLLVPYGKLWRLGANETTEIEFLKPVTIGGKKINPGRYAIYAIPSPKTWTFIINKDLYTFGAFNYNPANDVVRAEGNVSKGRFSLETFLIYFQKTATGCNLICSWDTEIASLPIMMN